MVKWTSKGFWPALICASVMALVGFLEWLADRDVLTPFQRVEWITYDWRVRMAVDRSSVVATNLGLVDISDRSIETLLDGSLPYQFGLQWPRQVYARLVNELNAQGASAIGFDVLFAEERPDHAPVLVNGTRLGSDEFFAQEIRRAGNVIVPAEKTLVPVDLFRTNAWAVADISADREVDGILRRAQAYSIVNIWHPLVRQAARDFGWKLETASIEKGKITFAAVADDDSVDDNFLIVNAVNEFDEATLLARLNGETTVPPRETVSTVMASTSQAAASTNQSVAPRWAKPFTKQRLWQLGILLAARDQNLDLNRARVDFEQGRIEIPDQEGKWRVIPVDRQGRFYINWSLTGADSRLLAEPIERLLARYELRRLGEEVINPWAGKIAFVGSTATGNNLTDLGATPLEHETYLISAHWNVANSLLTNQFVQPLGLGWRLVIIMAFGISGGVLTLKMRPLVALFCVGLLGVAYVAVACGVFVQSRVWLPIVLPIGGSLLITHGCLITYLVRHEREQRQRTKNIFSKIVSPDVVTELLGAKKLSLIGARRELTVFFADVRSFTEITDARQQLADSRAREQKLSGDEAKQFFDTEAAEVLATVNLYLGIAASCIKRHGGTLDKYIGDCVMAFWGAPVANPRHAVCCVRAIIDIQREIFELNQQRREENARRADENLQRAFRAQGPLPMLDILTLGSGVNTGMMTVGLMGSDAHLVNYTVFGREVNLASRLESASGRSRILIGEQTFLALLRDDPALAATCIEQPPLSLKGFRDAVRAYEVPWRPSDVSMDEAGQSMTIIRPKALREMS
jgi:class 3 adenylate cyclase/CHASE2 domain-containing sensor protein